MDYFKQVYDSLIKGIEKEFDIFLTLGEKVSLKYCLRHAQELYRDKENKLEEKIGLIHILEAKEIFLRQYGINYSEFLHVFGSLPNANECLKKHFKLVRNEILLL